MHELGYAGAIWAKREREIEIPDESSWHMAHRDTHRENVVFNLQTGRGVFAGDWGAFTKQFIPMALRTQETLHFLFDGIEFALHVDTDALRRILPTVVEELTANVRSESERERLIGVVLEEFGLAD